MFFSGVGNQITQKKNNSRPSVNIPQYLKSRVKAIKPGVAFLVNRT